MLFFDDKLGRRRVQDVTRISAAYQGSYAGQPRLVHNVEMNNGDCLVLLDVTVQDLLRSPFQVTQAESGLFVIVGYDEDRSPLLSPVLAWVTTLGGAVRPLTATGVNDDQEEDLPVVYPDGTVRYLGFNVYSSIEAYEAPRAEGEATAA